MNGPAARVPAMWPRVRVDVDDDGQLTIQANGQPWPPAASTTSSGSNQASPWQRGDLPKVVSQVAEALGSPIRVEVHDSGRTYAEVVLPTAHTTPGLHEAVDDDRSPATPSSVPAGTGALSGSVLHGRGFAPGEQVAIAVVVATTQANADGSVQLRVPLALRSRAASLLMHGQHSTQAQPLAPAPGTDRHADPAHPTPPLSPRPIQATGTSSGVTADPVQPVDDIGFANDAGLTDDEQVGAP